jgi:hydroxymethylpyrimidine/phosphomethylpyrimidine kinase
VRDVSAARSMPCALTIAGSDSGGGAGIQADLKTFAALGVHGLSALTALTAQNTRGISSIHPVPAEFLTAQIQAVAADFPIQAAKTGMLLNLSLVRAAAGAIRALGITSLIVDPVLLSKGGEALLAPDALTALKEELLPLARGVTPNLPEAEALVSRKLDGPGAIEEAAREIHAMGASSVVIKGGHRSGEPIDLLYDGSRFVYFQGERIRTSSDHGTGCTFSAALTGHLARGEDFVVAVGEAKRFVAQAMRNELKLGSGRGPLNYSVFEGRFD